jgi:ribosomal protein S18 acetylase RimI-like enzyme
MSIRMIRNTGEMAVSWPDGYCARPFTERDAVATAQVFLAAKVQCAEECEPGTLAGATCEVERYLTYHRQFAFYDAGIAASTLVIAPDCTPAAVCLIGINEDGQPDIYQIATHPAHRRRGLATGMIRRALTELSGEYPTLDLWVNPFCPNRLLYRSLGFVETGEEE